MSNQLNVKRGFRVASGSSPVFRRIRNTTFGALFLLWFSLAGNAPVQAYPWEDCTWTGNEHISQYTTDEMPWPMSHQDAMDVCWNEGQYFCEDYCYSYCESGLVDQGNCNAYEWPPFTGGYLADGSCVCSV